MSTCFHCGHDVVWQADFSYEDYGMEGDGIVQVCHCPGCGADILYMIPCDEPEDPEDDPEDPEDPEEPEDVMPGWDMADAPEWDPAE